MADRNMSDSNANYTCYNFQASVIFPENFWKYQIAGYFTTLLPTKHAKVIGI